ncbi:reverse transcriptase [Caerostris darwini]|uniref:Reverse transcriptase n=1 Tax=Caerostris darwini TaxID=1538125 RepID=A0AAV4RXQ8_9ARAC|nr:reverse transcriptase [Caerostris darwini]
MDFTCKAFDIPISHSHFHTDSIILFAWIGSHSSQWKTFVPNRVGKIQTLSSPTLWHSASGNENPADLATRESSGPTLDDPVSEERCSIQSTTAANHLPNSNELFLKYSSLYKLKRVTAYF